MSEFPGKGKVAVLKTSPETVLEDIEKLKDFYINYFGAQANNKYINEKKKFCSYFLSVGDGARIEIMEKEGITKDCRGEHYGYTHLAISVGSEKNVDELTEKIKNDGYSVVNGPRRTGDGYYESVILDPDGNRVEITYK